MKVRVHPAKILSSAVFALLFALGLPASAMDVTFDVQPKQLNLGETATATLIFQGVRSAPGVEFPPIPGLQITGAGQMVQTINGASSVRLNYNVFPQKPGIHTIGPYNLDFQGETVTIPAATLEVRAPNGNASAATNEMIFARIVLPEAPPYIHQVFDITLSLYSLPSVNLAHNVNLLGGFPESGFVMGNFEEQQTVREEINGQFYTLRRFRARARALTAGTFTLQPALRVGVVDRNQPQSRNPFGGFFDDPFRGPSATPVDVAIPSADLTIRSIPEAGRPALFSGAVGQFQFTMDVRPRELKVGEPITVTLRLQGTGNIAAALPPSYRDSETYKAYEARQVGDTPDPAAESGTKTFEQVVLPRTDELKALPALQFSFFDPEISQYRTLSAGPFPLTVHPSENGASALLLQVPGNVGVGGKALVLGSDIIYLKPAPARWIRDTAPPTGMLLGLHAAAPLALAGLYFATRRRNRLSSDIALARRQKAPRSARTALRKAETALRETPTAPAVFSPLAAAASDYFGHRLNLPPGAVDAPQILERLAKAQAGKDALAKWREFFALSDQIRYATPPVLSRDELAAWISSITSLLRQAERIKL